MQLLVNDVQAWRRMSVQDASTGDAGAGHLETQLFLTLHCIVGRGGSSRDDKGVRSQGLLRHFGKLRLTLARSHKTPDDVHLQRRGFWNDEIPDGEYLIDFCGVWEIQTGLSSVGGYTFNLFPTSS